ncbi:hypothetical protein BRD02_13180 [Halobacteriales archaeon QS_8_69_73]|nr:MAG: hypothetical protein BRC88_14215 [Halobacteriales archaeon QS_4_69_225]PSQ13421.1 MAG: hypothetical protein BRD02_13180 [Halobacteriales archaeon QS_8_69_73]
MQLRLRGEIESAFRYTFATTMVFLFAFDISEVYLDPLVTYNTFVYEVLVETLIVVVSIYVWSVVLGNAYNLTASSRRPEGG